MALIHNPSIETASAAAASAAAARWADWGAFLPTASGRTSFSSTAFTNATFLAPEGTSQQLQIPVNSTSKSASQSLDLGLTLFDMGRVADLRAGAARRDAAALRLTQAERQVVRDVKQRYFEALKQRRLVEVAERQLTARREDLRITEGRYKIAAAGRSDLLGAQIDLADAELRALDVRDAADRALRDLRVVLGAREYAGAAGNVKLEQLTDVGKVPPADGLDEEALARAALTGNPEIRALEADASAASAGLARQRFSYLPTITTGLSFSRSQQRGPGETLIDFGPANDAQTFSITARWNLFGGFTRKRQAADASRALRQARAQKTQKELEVEKGVRDRVAEIRRRARRLEILRTNHELARERLDLTREQYRLGSIPFFNLQQAIDRLTSAEEELFRERYDYLIAWADLELEVGRDL